MFIKISSMSAIDVFALLSESDQKSSFRTGSHDDSYYGIVVNGKVYEPFNYHYLYASIQNSGYKDRKEEPINRLPAEEEILTAAIVETHHHYGGNSRDRARVRIFTRSVRYQGYIQKAMEARAIDDMIEEERMMSWAKSSGTNQLFLVIDIGEVEGWWPYQKVDHRLDVSLMWAIWTAKKNVRIEVDPQVDPTVFRDMNHGFSAGNHPRYYHNYRAGSFEHLQSDNATKWFEAMIGAAVKTRDALIAMAPTINRYYWNEATKIKEALSLGVKDDLYKAFQTLWLALPIGDFLKGLGLR